jgi:deoxycytidine triphosphate deaminase
MAPIQVSGWLEVWGQLRSIDKDPRSPAEEDCLRPSLPVDGRCTKNWGLSAVATVGPNSERRIITAQQPFMLEHGTFVLGKTHERVALPIIEGAECLAARVEGRSSYSRFGLLMHFTAPTIHAGFDGTITLEFCNLGPAIIALYPRAPICQLIVERVEGTPFRNDSQFQGQKDAGGVF